ncbi:MAG: enolase [Halobacteria archaeon]
MAAIRGLALRVVSDSRGEPTVEAEVRTSRASGRAAAPSGASRGRWEAAVVAPALALRRAREARLEAKLRGFSSSDQEGVDALLHRLDGTRNLGRLGGNLAIAVSLAAAKAAAASEGLPLWRFLSPGMERPHLPLPLGNVINGGKHADSGPDIQEFLAAPVGARAASRAVFANAAVHREAGARLRRMGLEFGKGDEGGWAPSRITTQEALGVLQASARKVQRQTGISIAPALDVAASSLWDGRAYRYRNGAKSPGAQAGFMASLARRHRLAYLEDPLEEEDFEGFAEVTRAVGRRTLVCGDDLFVTSAVRIERGARMGAGNCVLIKPNQAGTLTDTRLAVDAARRRGYEIAVSHRSGETTDETIAHLAVAWRARFIKTGIAGGERIAKLNELIRIHEGRGTG